MVILLRDTPLWDEVDAEHNDLDVVAALSYGSKKTVWWKGRECGHLWPATPNNRRSSGCPYCAGKSILTGFNDLATVRPDLLVEWDYSNQLDPTQVAPSNKTEVGWICRAGHKYSQRIDVRKRSNGCSICSNRELLSGFNDLKTRYPEVAQWWSTNNKISSKDVLFYSTYEAWWTCERGHEYPMPVNWKTTHNLGCSVCSGRYLVPGVNDFATLHPELLEWWDYEANTANPQRHSPAVIHSTAGDALLRNIHSNSPLRV